MNFTLLNHRDFEICHCILSVLTNSQRERQTCTIPLSYLYVCMVYICIYSYMYICTYIYVCVLVCVFTRMHACGHICGRPEVNIRCYYLSPLYYNYFYCVRQGLSLNWGFTNWVNWPVSSTICLLKHLLSLVL